MSSENPAKDGVMSAKNVIKKDSSKSSIYSKTFSDSKSPLNDQHNPGFNLHRVRTETPSRIIFIQINNEFDWYMKLKNEIFFMTSESKIDNSFLISQFTMAGYSIPFRHDRTSR